MRWHTWGIRRYYAQEAPKPGIRLQGTCRLDLDAWWQGDRLRVDAVCDNCRARYYLEPSKHLERCLCCGLEVDRTPAPELQA